MDSPRWALEGWALQVRWRNFRSFEDTGWVDLKPITLVIGPNNTGKTSLYAPLLLLKQTYEASTYEPALVLRGKYLDAGAYEDVVFNHEPGRRIEFSFRLTSDDDRPPPLSQDAADPDLLPTELTLRFSPDGYAVVLASFELKDQSGRVLLSRKRRKSGSYTIGGEAWKRIGHAGQTSAPVKSFMSVMRTETPSNFLFVGADPVHYLMFHSGIEEMTPGPEPTADFAALFTAVHQYAHMLLTVRRGLEQLLSEVTFLGPLRAEPRRRYEISGNKPDSVGVRGEHAPELLFRSRDMELCSAVSSWMDRFGFGVRVHVESLDDPAVFGVWLETASAGLKINLSDCGFGASQVLPIVVEVLRTDSDSTTIVEQPEIHLNPRLQAMLADLFVAAAERKGRCVIETHSEHLFLRLRTLLALSQIDAKDVAVYFTEHMEGTSSFRRVPIGEAGEIDPDDWPAGFFNESLDESLRLALAQAGISDE